MDPLFDKGPEFTKELDKISIEWTNLTVSRVSRLKILRERFVKKGEEIVSLRDGVSTRQMRCFDVRSSHIQSALEHRRSRGGTIKTKILDHHHRALSGDMGHCCSRLLAREELEVEDAERKIRGIDVVGK